MTARRMLRRSDSRPGRRGRTAVAVGLLAPVGLSLAACGPPRAGSAVIIGSDRIPISQIQHQVSQVVQQRQQAGQDAQPAAALTQEQLQRLILSRIVARMAADQGVTVTQAEVDERRQSIVTQAGSQAAFDKQVASADIPPGTLDSYLKDRLLEGKIGQALVPNASTPAQQQELSAKISELAARTSRALGIKVNPRYGSWNADKFSLDPMSFGFVDPEPQAPQAPQQPQQ